MSAFSVTEDTQVVQWAFMDGLMPKLLDILLTGRSDDKATALFILSNIAGSSDDKDHIHALIEEDLLIDRVVELTHHAELVIASEATFVLTNAITCGS